MQIGRAVPLAALALVAAVAPAGARAEDAAAVAAGEVEPPAEAGVEAAGEAEAAPEVEAPPEAEDPALAEARQRFAQGVALARAGNCEGAIAELQASYRAAPRPNTLYNIAQCQERLFRYDLALRYYRQYLEEAPEDAPDRGAVETAMRLLATLLGTVHVRANVPSEVWVDDRRMGEAPGDVLVPSGRHVLELRAEGHLPARQELEVAGGAEVEVSLELEVARQTVTVHSHTTERVGLHQAYFWSGAALTVAAVAVAAGLGGWALGLASDLEAEDARLRTEGQLEEVDQAALATDIVWGVAGGFAIASLVLAFLTDWGTGQATELEGETTALRAQPFVLADGLGVAIGGRL